MMSIFGAHSSTEEKIPRVRRPAVAGRFYPAQPQRLRASIQKYLDVVEDRALSGTVRAVIAPHAGYMYSGPTAGYSFSALDIQPDQDHVIFLLGPAHYVPISGVALGQYETLETPLGQVPVAGDVVEALSKNTLFEIRNDAHAPEHCLEVELPFLQERAGSGLRMVPMLLRDADPRDVADALYPFILSDSSTRVVVSSDLSHFHPYDQASRMDKALLDAIVRGDIQAVGRGEACGREAILALMLLADRLGWHPHLLAYSNSGDTSGDYSGVVGYGAIAYTEDK